MAKWGPMLKEICDRLVYALIGLFFGAVLAVVLWFLYDAGFSRRSEGVGVHPGLMNWIMCSGGFFAAVGFLFKASVGSAVGSTVRGIYDHERGGDPNLQIPAWLAILLFNGVALGVWYWLR